MNYQNNNKLIKIMANCLEEELLLNEEPSNNQLMTKILEVLNHTKAASDTVNNYIQSNDARMGKVESRVEAHHNRLDIIEHKLDKLSEQSETIHTANEVFKQNLLRNNLVVVGIPNDYGDDTNQIIFNIAAILKVKINRNDIIQSYRVKKSYSGLIVVRFAATERRDELLRNKQKISISLGDLFELTGDSASKPIYLNAHVTPYFGKLSAKARTAIKENLIHSFNISTRGLMVKSTMNSYQYTRTIG